MRNFHRLQRFTVDVLTHTPVVKMFILLVVLWVAFSAGVWLAEQQASETRIPSFGDALYWGIAAFSTAGIADTPVTGLAKFIGGVWIVLGSALFFGTIVATITTYFLRPLKRPARQIIDTIEYNLEQMDDLSIAELDLLKQTTDTLITQMEQIKQAQTRAGD